MISLTIFILEVATKSGSCLKNRADVWEEAQIFSSDKTEQNQSDFQKMYFLGANYDFQSPWEGGKNNIKITMVLASHRFQIKFWICQLLTAWFWYIYYTIWALVPALSDEANNASSFFFFPKGCCEGQIILC